ncbi:MAG: thiamine pyrophosphate-dependent enzyme, partial [Candidatus Zixiibacteriota bacterium]
PALFRVQYKIYSFKKSDPIARAEVLLMDLGILTTQQREAIVEQYNQEIDEAIAICEKEKYAEPEEAYNDVYSESFPVRRDEY